MEKSQYTISLVVNNKPGVLARIVGLFSGRGYNIDSLCVTETTENSISRITITTSGNEAMIEQIKKQLHKLIDIIKVNEVEHESYVERELVLVKVNANKPDARAEILRIVDIFRAKIVDVGSEQYIIEVSGYKKKVKGFLELLKPFGIKDIAQTGAVALPK